MQALIVKIEKILKGCLDLIPSPSPFVKIQIMGGKLWLRCKDKTLLGVVNKLFVFKSLLTTPRNVLPLRLNLTFPPLIWIFTKGEGDGIESRLPFKIFSTLSTALWVICCIMHALFELPMDALLGPSIRNVGTFSKYLTPFSPMPPLSLLTNSSSICHKLLALVFSI